jgi:dihydrofolate synthase/folylpolyglutamate synthase
MTYQEAVDYLMSFWDLEKQTGLKYKDPHYSLDSFKELLAELGNPQNSFKSILIAGTKGKGSTAALVESALRAQGHATGLYTSPHLISFCERIRHNGKYILERDFAQRIEWLKPFLEKRRPGPKLPKTQQATVFEILTAMAFLYFQEMGVEWAVLEAGMGGRLDCTNTVNPRVSGITNISLDHTDVLGNTLTEIAREKAGIIRQDGLVVTAPQSTEAGKVIFQTAQKLNARLFQVGKDLGFKVVEQDGHQTVIDLAGTFGKMTNLTVGLAGEFQAENAAVAFGILRSLQYRNQLVPDDAIRQGFRQVSWPGRFQVVSQKPLTVLDGAHNDYSAYRLKKATEAVFPDRSQVLVLGISANKDLAGIVSNLARDTKAVIITKARHSRAAAPESIKKELLRLGIAAIETDRLETALERARELAAEQDMIIVTGSLFLVGEALELFGRPGMK